MIKEINSEIIIEFINKNLAQIFFNSLISEVEESSRCRSQTELSLVNNKLKILIYAKDVTAFRANINSYLNWIKIIDDIIQII